MGKNTVSDKRKSVKSISLVKCSRCGCEAEADWVMIPDSHWSSYFVGCANDLCDSMVSAEVDDAKRDLAKIEGAVRTAWNTIHAK